MWDEYSYVYDLTNRQPIQQMTRTFAFDRHTGQLVNCCGASLNGDRSVRQSGLVGYVFPIGTQKRTYQVFDTTLKRPVPFAYSGTATVDGIQTYEFVENVAPVQVATVPVPGSFVGVKAALVRAPEFDQLHLIYYVDPETGALLSVNQHQTVTLRSPATGATALVLFDADLIATPATVHQIVALDGSGRSELTLLETTLPLVLGIAGGVALIAGIFLGRKPHDAMAELIDAAREAPAPTTAESGQDQHSGELAGVAPGLGDETQELAAEAPEGEGPDAPDAPGAP